MAREGGCANSFFLSTLNTGEWSVYSWLYKTKDVVSDGIPKLKSGRDSRNISQTRNKSCPRMAFAETFLKLLPKMESHYWRSTITFTVVPRVLHKINRGQSANQ